MMKKIVLFIAICVFVVLPVNSQNHSSLRESIVRVASGVGKSVVSISSVMKERVGGEFSFESPFGEHEEDYFQRFFEEFFGDLPEREHKRAILGSGVIINKDGYILTSSHVVSGATKIKVDLPDGREFDAQVKGTDERSDLAVIKIEASNLPAAQLGNSDNLKIGEWVVAIGNPFGPYIENPEPTVTVGVVSALHRFLPALGRGGSCDDLIQTDAAINPGNSGGPLVDLEGKVIGINTAILSRSGGYQGLGFAIPVNKARRVLDKLIKGEKIFYGWLGINVQDLNEDLCNYFGIKEKEGAIVLKVYKDSPSEAGGLKEGDLILAFNDRPVRATRDLVRMVSSSEVGKTVPVKIIRSGKTSTLRIKIGKSPEDVEELDKLDQEVKFTFRGMTVDDVTAFYKRKLGVKVDKGVVVTEIEAGSLADISGFIVGDVIVKVEDKKIQEKEDFKSAILKTDKSCLLKTSRGYFVLKAAE